MKIKSLIFFLVTIFLKSIYAQSGCNVCGTVNPTVACSSVSQYYQCDSLGSFASTLQSCGLNEVCVDGSPFCVPSVNTATCGNPVRQTLAPTTATTPLPQSTTTAPLDVNLFCSNKIFGNYDYPGNKDCTRFISCYFSILSGRMVGRVRRCYFSHYRSDLRRCAVFYTCPVV